jgi:hypothetical protein
MKRILFGLVAAGFLPALAAAQDFSTMPAEPLPGDWDSAPMTGGWGTDPAAAGGWTGEPVSPGGFGGPGDGIIRADSAPAPTGGFGAPGPGAAPAGRPAFSLYRGSEGTLALSYLRSTPGGGSFTTLSVDTRHSLWLAPFLGSQIDLGLASLDGDQTAITAGLHLHLMPETGERFGIFWLPAWDGGLDDRLDNYGIEGIFGAIEGLTVEARIGRFSGDDLRGPYFGARGFYALDGATALTADFQHTRLTAAGTDVNATSAMVGGEYYMPGTALRLEGAVGLVRFGGDVASETDLRFEVGATLFAFGEQPGPARMRTFGRQALFGTF